MSKEVSGFISWLRSWFDSIYEIATNKTSNWTNTPNDIRYPSEKLVKDSLDTKSDNGHTHISEDITDISLTSLSEALDKLVQPEIDDKFTNIWIVNAIPSASEITEYEATYNYPFSKIQYLCHYGEATYETDYYKKNNNSWSLIDFDNEFTSNENVLGVCVDLLNFTDRYDERHYFVKHKYVYDIGLKKYFELKNIYE